MRPILPGSTLGILGSGQLGRMLAVEARRMGYQTHVFSPEPADSPAGQVADIVTTAAYTDTAALTRFAASVDVVTVEFENIPASALQTVSQTVPVRPGAHVLSVCQHRLAEKQFLSQHGLPVVPFVPVDSLADLQAGLAKLGTPAVLKTAGWGYDGKGQVKITRPEEAEAAWAQLGPAEVGYVLEQFIAFDKELSVLVARSISGDVACYPVVENRHERHVLDISSVPAAISPAVEAEAVRLAQKIVVALDVVGLLAVEFFLTAEGSLCINELAPRPHNSGHWTLEAAVTSQFEQQLRAVCGLPLGETRLLTPVAMANLLGDIWQPGEPQWQAACAVPGVALHLYGKAEAKPGRKMGHLTAVAESVDEAIHRVNRARHALLQSSPLALGGEG